MREWLLAPESNPQPPFDGHFVDLLTSDGHHLGAIGRDGGVCPHQATFIS